MPDLNTSLQALLDDMTTSGAEIGLQVAAYYRGELVADVWSGLADPTSGRPVDGQTLFTAFSATKGVTATVIHLLADKGLLDYDAPIARYWRQFGARGKEAITVAQVLAHTAGVPQMPRGVTVETMIDWEAMVAAIADLEPLWEPGTQTGYHGLTFGWILGEVARRVTGEAFPRLVDQLIASPLGLEDLYLGVPEGELDRVATLASGPISRKPISPDALLLKAMPISVSPQPKVYNRADVRQAVLPGGGGVMTARALAKLYAALVGEVDGRRLMREERLAMATTLQTDRHDLVLDEHQRKALGYMLGSETSPLGPLPYVFGHPGAGGSLGFGDPRHGFAFALTKNRLVWDRPVHETAAFRVGQHLRKALGLPIS